MNVLISYCLSSGLNHFYERPWVDFFRKSTRFLLIETIILALANYCFPLRLKWFYGLYSYVWLCHTVYLVRLSFFEAAWASKWVPTSTKNWLLSVWRGLLLFIIYYGFYGLGWSYVWLDRFLLLLVLVWFFRNRQRITPLLRFFYSNLNREMKKHLYFYLAINGINLLIYYNLR